MSTEAEITDEALEALRQEMNTARIAMNMAYAAAHKAIEDHDRAMDRYNQACAAWRGAMRGIGLTVQHDGKDSTR